MCEDTDLPDHDYASIYGREAMHARLLARLDTIERRMEERSAWLDQQHRMLEATVLQRKAEAEA
jgi:hypothetical protein